MEQDFIFQQKRNNSKDLILFVHGFTGDATDTWENKNGNSFPLLLLQDSYINKNFDVASYNYFSTLLNLFANTKEKYRRIKSFIRRITHKKERNLDITELANNLSNHLRFTLQQYDNIYVIAHSMGGLITKSLISEELKSKGSTKVKLFISLAVPHQGAELSVLGGIISSNLQISNLNPVKEFINSLNQHWVCLDEKPVTKYFYGNYDDVVTKHSAVAIDKVEKDIVSAAEDHNSISKPENKSSIVYTSVLYFLIEAHKHSILHDTGFQKLPQNQQLDSELFVIKLIVSGVARDSQDHAKELFFNAEYVRKLFNSRHDKKQIQQLFDNIRQLYKDSYDGFLANYSMNSGQLLAEVHTKITDNDSKLLKSLIPTLQSYHKKGMLHQLANNSESDIWWSKDKCLTIKE
jgi:esterase/lipase